MIKIGRTTTKEERLAWSPTEAVDTAWLTRQRVEVANAMFDQLESAGVELEVLELCIAMWATALDDAPPGAVGTERLATLDDGLEYYDEISPALGEWNAALRRQVATTEDLQTVVNFLLQVRQTWLSISQMSGRS